MPRSVGESALVDHVDAIAHRLTSRVGHFLQRIGARNLADRLALAPKGLEIASLVRETFLLQKVAEFVLRRLGSALGPTPDHQVEGGAVWAAEEIDEVFGGVEDADRVERHGGFAGG